MYNYPIFRKAVQHPVAACILAFIAAFIFVDGMINDPVVNDPYAKAELFAEAGQPRDADALLFQVARNAPFDIDKQYRYVQYHFTLPAEEYQKNNTIIRDDKTPLGFYDSLIKFGGEQLKDIGWYSKGLIYSNMAQYNAALTCYLNVKNGRLKYLNNSIGYVQKELKHPEEAEIYFKQEIANKGNYAAAVSNLGELYLSGKRTNAFDSLLNNPDYKTSLSHKDLSRFYFENGKVNEYAQLKFSDYLSGITWWGFLAAFLIMAAWVIFLQKLDSFEKGSVKITALALLLGMAFTFLAYPLYEAAEYYYNFKPDGSLVNDFVYCLFGIGLIEETVKLLPLLILLRFTKSVNEPFDYIKIACLSALGFAFVENMQYFHTGAANFIHGRALIAVVHHMFNSSLIAYGFVLARYRWKKSPWLVVPLFLLLASVSHGFYDFWLINESASRLSIITLVYALFSINIWNTILNNSMNNSSFFNDERKPDLPKLRAHLLFMLSAVFLFEFVLQGFLFGPSIANHGFFASLYSGTYLMLFISGRLSALNLKKGEWKKIELNQQNTKPGHSFTVTTGMHVNIREFTNDPFLQKFLPNTGVIEKKTIVFKEENWLMIRIKKPAAVTDYFNNILLIRTKDPEDNLNDELPTDISVYALRITSNPDNFFFEKEDIRFCGWGKAIVISEEPAPDYSTGSI